MKNRELGEKTKSYMERKGRMKKSTNKPLKTPSQRETVDEPTLSEGN